MTAVNLEGGFKPETERGEEPNEALKTRHGKLLLLALLPRPGANVPF